MLIHCDQCHSKYKVTIKKIPSKPVNFRCGKCQNTILISPEELRKDLGPAPAPPAETAAPSPEVPSPEPAPPSDTVQLTCLKCGAGFVKHQDDKARLCYQCRIDSIVTKIKDKYGVTQEVELPEAKSKYTFRSPDGLVLGPIKLKTVAVLVREKRLQGQEEVSKDGGEFRPLSELEELRKLFPDLAAPAPAEPEGPREEHEEEIPLDLDEAPPPPALGAQGLSRFQRDDPPAPAAPAKPAPPPPPAASSPQNISRYKLRYLDGLVLGPIRLVAVEDLVAAGNLTGQEEVQKDNGAWKPFLDFPELKQLLGSGEEIAEDEIVELTDLLEEVS